MTPLDATIALLIAAAFLFAGLDALHRHRERRRPGLVMQAWRLGLRTDRDEPLHRLERRVQVALAARDRGDT